MDENIGRESTRDAYNREVYEAKHLNLIDKVDKNDAAVHRRISEEKLDICKDLKCHEKKLERHDDELNELKLFKNSTEGALNNLAIQIGSLVGIIKWASVTIIMTLLGFFIWYIQTLGGI